MGRASLDQDISRPEQGFVPVGNRHDLAGKDDVVVHGLVAVHGWILRSLHLDFGRIDALEIPTHRFR